MVRKHFQLMEQEVYEKIAYQILLNILADNDCINRYEPVPENLKEKAKEIAESLKPVLDEFVDCVAEGDEFVQLGWFEGYKKLSDELNEFFKHC